MATANIADRAGLERIYPAEAFASDAAQNDDLATGLERGVRVLSAPDAGGAFGVERATRQVGEAQSPSFLVPRRRRAAAARPGPAGRLRGISRPTSSRRRGGSASRPKTRPGEAIRASAVCGSSARGQTCWIAESSQAPPRGRMKVQISSASTGTRGSPPTIASGSPAAAPRRTA